MHLFIKSLAPSFFLMSIGTVYIFSNVIKEESLDFSRYIILK